MRFLLERALRYFAFAAAGAAALAPDAVAAHELGIRPSDLVTLSAVQPNGAACPLGGAAFAQVGVSSPPTPFTVPARRVLVVTAIQILVNGAGALDKSALLTAQTASAEQLLTAGSLTLDPSGDGGTSIVLPSGLRVASGRTVCLRSGAAVAGGYVHGYLAFDR